jgi:uncharacterized protein (UPF0332 family)
LTTAQLLAKAQRALLSAKELLASNDPDGACNRAYYAMFDAARAALLSINAPVLPETIKTHAGLNRAFALHIVKQGLFPVVIGKAIQQVEELRLIADYDGNPLEATAAAQAVEQAENFVKEILRLMTRLTL